MPKVVGHTSERQLMLCESGSGQLERPRAGVPVPDSKGSTRTTPRERQQGLVTRGIGGHSSENGVSRQNACRDCAAGAAATIFPRRSGRKGAGCAR